MKLKFRAEKKDVIAFAVISVFMLYLVCLCVLNFSFIINEGTPWGLNPFLAFTPKYIGVTIMLWIASIAFLFASTSSYFFTREKGFGYTSEKKEDGYARWAKEGEIKKAKGVVRVPYVEKEAKAGGTPLVYDKEAAYVDNGESHTLVIGATGSGKTQGIINPTVQMLIKGRESMIISDPKGEIYNDNSGIMRELGYQIIILNFRDPQKGNCWNPYHLPYKYQKEGNFDKANELLNDLSLNIVVDGQGQDPFWQNSAASYLTGLSLALFEDAPEEEININSVNLMMTTGEDKYGASNYLKEYFNAKDPASPACINALGTVNAPNETKGGIVSVLKDKVKTLAVTKNLSEMLSKSDFDMDSIGEKPTAVFMIIQDEKTTYHSLTTIFVKQCYESLIDVAQENGGKLAIRTNFILDEFANMPELKDVTTMITAARSRQIRFNLIIQNFAQLNQVYGKENAETIKGNCGNMIYLLSSELNALEEISKLCGERKVKGKGKDKPDETRPLITVSDLQRLQFKDAIIKKHRMDPFKTKLRGVDEYNWNIPKYEKAAYPERQKHSIETFDMRTFVKEKKKESMMNSPLGSSLKDNPPFKSSMPIDRPPMNFPSKSITKSDEDEFDVDELIKKIDAKIAELEKEEEMEKSKEINNSIKENKVIDIDDNIKEKINKNNDDLKKIIEPDTKDAVKVSEDIDKIINDIEDEDTTDDQFFDDFFFDE